MLQSTQVAELLSGSSGNVDGGRSRSSTSGGGGGGGRRAIGGRTQVVWAGVGRKIAGVGDHEMAMVRDAVAQSRADRYGALSSLAANSR
jgi:hypothetical protein